MLSEKNMDPIIGGDMNTEIGRGSALDVSSSFGRDYHEFEKRMRRHTSGGRMGFEELLGPPEDFRLYFHAIRHGHPLIFCKL